MTHSYTVVSELQFPLLKQKINNKEHPHNVPPLLSCSWRVDTREYVVRISLKGKSEMLVLFQNEYRFVHSFLFFGINLETHKHSE